MNLVNQMMKINKKEKEKSLFLKKYVLSIAKNGAENLKLVVQHS